MVNHSSLLLLLMTALTVTNLRLISSTTESPPPSSVPSIPPQPPASSPPSIPPPPPPPLFSTATPPSSSTPTAIPPPPSSPAEVQEQQLNNIIDALIGAGDFAGWANIISNTNPSTLNLPLTATLFVPGNDALSHLSSSITTATGAFNFDPLMILYHIVPQRLSFSELQLFKTQTRLPTLLPSKTLLITDNSPSNFTIDNSPITHPDIYVNTAISVHGIGTVLDYTIYGGTFQMQSPPEVVAPPPPPFLPSGEGSMGRPPRSDAACVCTEVPVVLLVCCAVFAFKILRNPLKH